MRIRKIRSKTNGKIYVGWTQSGPQGDEKRHVEDCPSPEPAMVDAMNALMPHIAKVLNLDEKQAKDLYFMEYKTTTARGTWQGANTEDDMAQFQVIYNIPGNNLPGACKTPRVLFDAPDHPKREEAVMDSEFREACEALEVTAKAYVKTQVAATA